MMDAIGVFTPEQAQLLWHDYQRRQQLHPHIAQNFPQRRPIDEVSPHRVLVKNTEEETIPAYACMRIIGVEVVGDRTTLKVEKPTSVEGEFVFNSQFEIPATTGGVVGTGWAYRFGVVVMLGNGTSPTAANVQYTPVVGEWTIAEGSGPFIVFGEHNVATDALIGRFSGSGGGSHHVWATVLEVFCDPYGDPLLTYVTASVTWYTGGCTAAIPGEDSYTGLIDVYQVCDIFTAYYTAEDLVGKTIKATYMYPRSGECVPQWIVDEVCGQPECA